MLTACWSPKGGCGTTVVCCALAVVLARAGDDPPGALLVDLSGDLPAALGMVPGGGPGVADWLAADPGVGVEALGAMEVDAGNGLAVLPWVTSSSSGSPPGTGTGGGVRGSQTEHAEPTERAEDLVAGLSAGSRPVLVDCGRADTGPALAVAAAADRSFMVLRPCYLAMRRALEAPIRPSGIIVVREPDRALAVRDIEEVLGVPVLAGVAFDPAVARAVDAGLLARRLPRGLERALRGAA